MQFSHLGDPKDYRYSFTVHWFDQLASLLREYVLSFFTKDNTIEMIDVKTKRPFLKRSPAGDVKLVNLFPGATVVIYGRQLKVVDYADPYTKEAMLERKERAFLLLHPPIYLKTGEIFGAIQSSDFVIAHCKTVILTNEDVKILFKGNNNTSLVNKLSVAVEVIGPRCVEALGAVLGLDNPADSKKSQKTLRTLYGNNFSLSANSQEALTQLDYIFGTYHPTTATLTRCTVGIILPHAISDGCLPPILSNILTCPAFEVTAFELFQMEKQNAEEFYEVYQTVIPEFPFMVDELCNGPCLALEIRARANDEDVVSVFRDYVGPVDPAVARTLRPDSIRAKYGVSRIRNAIHSTDLPEDGELESEYFFRILQQK